MNKYAEQARAAQRARKMRRMCGDKRRFATAAVAQQKGQRIYQCPHCHGWHRSGQLATLVAEVRR
jgi:hypothetical protein